VNTKEGPARQLHQKAIFGGLSIGLLLSRSGRIGIIGTAVKLQSLGRGPYVFFYKHNSLGSGTNASLFHCSFSGMIRLSIYVITEKCFVCF